MIFHFEVKRKFGEEQVDPIKNKTETQREESVQLSINEGD